MERNSLSYLVNIESAVCSNFFENIEFLEFLIGISRKRKLKIFLILEELIWENFNKNGSENFSEFFQNLMIQNGLINVLLSLFKKKHILKNFQNKKISTKINLQFIIKVFDFLTEFIKLNPNQQIKNNLLKNLKKESVAYLNDISQNDIDSNSFLNYINFIEKVKKIITDEEELLNLEIQNKKIDLIISYLKHPKINEKSIIELVLNKYNKEITNKKRRISLSKDFLEKDILFFLFQDKYLRSMLKNIHPFLNFMGSSINYQTLENLMIIEKNEIGQDKGLIKNGLDVLSKNLDNEIIYKVIEKCYKNLNEVNEPMMNLLVNYIDIENDNYLKDFIDNFLDSNNYNVEIKGKILDFFFKILNDPSSTMDEKISEIALKGFKKLVRIYPVKKELILFFEIAFRNFMEINTNLETLIILKSIVKHCVNLNIFNENTYDENHDFDFIKKSKFLEIMMEFLFENEDKMADYEDTNMFKQYFKFFSYVLKRIPGLNLNEIYFKKIWVFCFESNKYILRKEFQIFLKKHYDEELKNFRIFPSYFNQNNLQIKNGSLEYYETYFFLFNKINENAGNIFIKTIDNNLPYLEIKESIYNLLGVEQLWKFIYLSSNPKLLNIIIDFAMRIYRGFPIYNNFTIIKETNSDYMLNFKKYLVKGKKDNFAEGINNILSFGIIFLKDLKGKKKIINIGEEETDILVRYNNKEFDVRCSKNYSLMGLLLILKKKFKFSNGLYILMNYKPIKLLTILENYPVSRILINNNEKEICIRQTKMVDLKKEKKEFKKNFLDDEEIYDVYLQLLENPDEFYRTNISKYLEIIPIHHKFYEFFDRIMGIRKADIKKQLSFQNEIKFNFLISLLKKILLKKKKNIQIKKKILENKILSFLEFIIFLNTYPDTKKIYFNDTRIRVLEILNIVITHPLKFFREQNLVKDILNQLYNHINEIQKKTLIIPNQKEKIKTIITFYFTMKFTGQIKLPTILTYFENILQEDNSEINFDIILNISENIHKFKFNEKDLKDFLFYLKNKNIDSCSSFSFILLDLSLKIINKKKIEEQHLIEKIKKLLNQTFHFLDPNINYEFLFFFTNLILSYLKKYNFPMDLHNKVHEWLNFYIFRTGKLETKINYYSIFSNKDFFKTILKLLKRLLKQHNTTSKEVILLLSNFITEQIFRDNRLDDWSLDKLVEPINSNNESRGLYNLGSTCYINSSLQQLFSIKDFSDYITYLNNVGDNSTLHNVI